MRDASEQAASPASDAQETASHTPVVERLTVEADTGTTGPIVVPHESDGKKRRGIRFGWDNLTYTTRVTAAFAFIAAMTALVAIGVLSFVWEQHFQTYTQANIYKLAESTAEQIAEIYSDTGTLDNVGIATVAGYAAKLNGVGVKAVNMLSEEFTARSVRDGEARTVTFAKGLEVSDRWESGVNEKNGTFISYRVDKEIFGEYAYNLEYVEQKIRNYSYLNLGLTLNFNGKSYVSKNGLLDLVNDNMTEDPLYPPIHLTGEDIEVVITHGTGYGESYDSFVNGQHTTQGGTHQTALRAAVAKTVKEFYHKDYDPSDIRTSIIAAISIKVTDPIFENQMKTKYGSKEVEPGVSVNNFVADFLTKHLDDYLHKHAETAQILQRKIVENEKERKAISGIQKKARETAKKVSLNNKKLRDCKIHRTDRNELAEQSMIFITEGNSASGSITKSRDVRTQAVFSLRGKPLNCFGLTKKVVYENEEFNLLQAALNIEEDMDNLRYNKVVIATDADVDGMHIRLLLMTFFLQFFPDVIRGGHLYVLQTPLFRVRNKKETHYCYSEEEKNRAVARCGANAEITRFKGLGEISPDEFRGFIGQDIRLDKVRLTKDDPIHDMLEFYMGKNTYERQGFIIGNLRIEEDIVESDLAIG